MNISNADAGTGWSVAKVNARILSLWRLDIMHMILAVRVMMVPVTSAVSVVMTIVVPMVVMMIVTMAVIDLIGLGVQPFGDVRDLGVGIV